jgi:hypothetical protein
MIPRYQNIQKLLGKVVQDKDGTESSYKKTKTISELRKLYAFSKIMKTYLFIPTLFFWLMAVFSNNMTFFKISIVGTFLAIIETVIRAKTEDINDEERYVRTRFDKVYGEGEYNRTAKEI